MVVLKNVFLRYVKEYDSLHDVNLKIEYPSILQIVGDEISSKNLLIRVIGGLQNISHGQVLFNGQDIHCIPVQDREIGYIGKSLNFKANQTVWGNLYHVLKIRKINKKVAIKQILTILSENGMQQLLYKKIKHLSYFEKVRLAILRMNLIKRKMILVEDIFQELSDDEIQECMRLILKQKDDAMIILATSKTYLDEKSITIKSGVIEYDEQS